MNSPALPIVLKRLPDEATSSWLHRIGKVYDVEPHDLLDEWLVDMMDNCTIRRSSVEGRINRLTAQAIAHKVRIPDSMADCLIPGPAAWITASNLPLPVCPKCLLSDDRKRRARYKRAEWAYSWRTTCSRHRTLLIYSEDWEDPSIAAKGFGIPRRQSALARTRPMQAVALRPSNHVSDEYAIASIVEIETAIRRALAGVSPPQKHWGPIKAADFLQVVQDLSTFVLTNFSEKALPPICTMDLAQFYRSGEVSCFARRGRYFEPWARFSKVVTLSSVGDPGMRRCALFWVRDLMHVNSARRWIDVHVRTDRPRRQLRVIERQCSEGLAWLSERMQYWPPKYRERWWSSIRHLGMPTQPGPGH